MASGTKAVTVDGLHTDMNGLVPLFFKVHHQKGESESKNTPHIYKWRIFCFAPLFFKKIVRQNSAISAKPPLFDGELYFSIYADFLRLRVRSYRGSTIPEPTAILHP